MLVSSKEVKIVVIAFLVERAVAFKVAQDSVIDAPAADADDFSCWFCYCCFVFVVLAILLLMIIILFLVLMLMLILLLSWLLLLSLLKMVDGHHFWS